VTNSYEPPPLTPADTRVVLRQLGDLTARIVLIGGQALAFWAEHFASRFPVVEPVNSSDIDFCGLRDAVALCAARLGGTPLYPEPFSPTPNVGVVMFRDSAHNERKIDFVDPFGLDYDEVCKMAISVDVPDGNNAVSFLVMHPVHCLESRTCNVSGLPGYRTTLGLAQLRASVICARAYLRDRLDAGDDKAMRAVLDLNERVYRFAHSNRHAIAVFRDFQIDPFAAVLVDDRLPIPFHDKRLPQMRETLARKRAKFCMDTH
jgi:hypothetical protein